MKHNLFVDFHILQDIPPANLNRDDSGSPKTAEYGGVTRLRVSSQAWKRATRRAFTELDDISPTTLGVRTRRVTQSLTDALVRNGVDQDAATPIAAKLLEQIKIKPGKKEDESAYLFFYSVPQLDRISQEVARRPDLWADPQTLAKEIDIVAILDVNHSLDVALFGRMVADLADLNVDAACQVAHAIGTHQMTPQADYYTAVDDAQGEDETGAGMIGTIEFGSSTVYRYASLSVPGLIDNMGDPEKAIEGIGQFARAFVLSLPSGKQNTFAAHTRPSLIHVTVRQDQPVNFVSAFERPVQPDREGYISSSVRTLDSFVQDEAALWGDRPLYAGTACTPALTELAPYLCRDGAMALPELLDQVRNVVAGALGETTNDA